MCEFTRVSNNSGGRALAKLRITLTLARCNEDVVTPGNDARPPNERTVVIYVVLRNGMAWWVQHSSWEAFRACLPLLSGTSSGTKFRTRVFYCVNEKEKASGPSWKYSDRSMRVHWALNRGLLWEEKCRFSRKRNKSRTHCNNIIFIPRKRNLSLKVEHSVII